MRGLGWSLVCLTLACGDDPEPRRIAAAAPTPLAIESPIGGDGDYVFFDDGGFLHRLDKRTLDSEIVSREFWAPRRLVVPKGDHIYLQANLGEDRALLKLPKIGGEPTAIDIDVAAFVIESEEIFAVGFVGPQSYVHTAPYRLDPETQVRSYIGSAIVPRTSGPAVLGTSDELVMLCTGRDILAGSKDGFSTYSLLVDNIRTCVFFAGAAYYRSATGRNSEVSSVRAREARRVALKIPPHAGRFATIHEITSSPAGVLVRSSLGLFRLNDEGTTCLTTRDIPTPVYADSTHVYWKEDGALMRLETDS